MVKVTFVKIGYIATTTLIDALLDERSGRKDLQMRVVSSSVSMEEDAAIDVAKIAVGHSLRPLCDRLPKRGDARAYEGP